MSVDQSVATNVGYSGTARNLIQAGAALPVPNRHPSFAVVDEKRLDSQIAATIALMLEWNRLTPHNDIDVVVHGGNVSLTGYVHAPGDREEAEILTRRIPGVHNVDNGIEIVTGDTLSTQLKSAITKVLLRHTQQLCSDLNVEVRNGMAIVTGTVESIAQ